MKKKSPAKNISKAPPSTKSSRKRSSSTGKPQKVKKSILSKILGRNPRIFAIEVEAKGKSGFLRFVSVLGESGITYVPTIVDTFEQSSKFVSIESAKINLSSISDIYGPSLKARIVDRQ